mgnify:FL=1
MWLGRRTQRVQAAEELWHGDGTLSEQEFSLFTIVDGLCSVSRRPRPLRTTSDNNSSISHLICISNRAHAVGS